MFKILSNTLFPTSCENSKDNGQALIMADNQEWVEMEKTYDRIVSAIIADSPQKELKGTMDWIKQVLDYNVPHGKRTRGLMAVQTYRLLAEQENRVVKGEQLELARILGWTVEWLQAYFLIVDDMMDQSITRRGQPCWYKLDYVGLMSCNDAILVDQELYHILRMYFSDKKYYNKLVDLMHETARYTAYGQNMDTASNPIGKGPQFEQFTQLRYDSIIKYKTAFYSFVLPVRLAMYMSSYDSEKEHRNAEEILLKIGHLFQIQDDYLDCYGDPDVMGKIGTDIEEGKCSWLAMSALKIGNETQKQTLRDNLGKKEANCVKRVKDLYNDLKLKDLFHEEEEKQYKDICLDIENLKQKSRLNPKIFTTFLSRIYRRKK